MKSFRGEEKREQGKTEACEFHLNDEEELSTNYTDYTDKKTIKHGQQTGVEARGNEYLIVPVPFYCPAACALENLKVDPFQMPPRIPDRQDQMNMSYGV